MIEWHCMWYEIAAGAVGGLMYAVWKDDLFLPTVSNRRIFLGCLKAVLLGAFVGFIVDTHPVLSALMGFSFNDVVNAIQRRVSKTVNDWADNAKIK